MKVEAIFDENEGSDIDALSDFRAELFFVFEELIVFLLKKRYIEKIDPPQPE
ncbi:MAG: hypothetical protein ACC656_15355 [Candidatus Heimdallarchaeota archaeon]